jgi:LPLT family lysophospholipid transporter-like MFS transporter
MPAHRNYLLLLASQFLSAFGENATWVIIIGQLTFAKKTGHLTEQELSGANAVYTSLLFLPYVLFAPLAGYLNDRHAKTRCLLGGNLIKLLGTLVAALSIQRGAAWQELGYSILGIGACIHSPAKYGILPEILPVERLVKANGTLEMLTLVAILTGLLCGASLVDSLPVFTCFTIVWLIFGAAAALNTAMSTTPSDPSVGLKASARDFGRHLRRLFANRRLAWILIGTSLFWACVAVFKINFQPWGLVVLGLKDNTGVALLNLWIAVGVMTGSVLAGEIHPVGDLRATRFYGYGLAGFIGWLGLLQAPITDGVVIMVLILAGISAGLFLVPLDAALQAESDPLKLGKTIATQNFLNNLAMMAGGSFIWINAQAGNNASGNFLLLAALVSITCLFLRIPAKHP